MKVLNLIIKQKYFDEIINGTKVQEVREIKPTTAKKLVELDEEGYQVVDEHQNSVPIKYDAIRFFVGYNKDRDSALVEVESAYTEILTQTLTDMEGNPMVFEADEDGRIIYYETNDDGFKTDADGNLIRTFDMDNGVPKRIFDGRKGATIEMPIKYEHDGDYWVAEQVVYNLGKILEKSVKPKIQK